MHYFFTVQKGVEKKRMQLELAALLNNYQIETQFIKIKNFQHPNINLIIPMPREKAINKNSDALKCLSEKSIDKLIQMKKR